MDTYYIHIPKTAGRSISELLDISWRGPIVAHSTVKSIITTIGEDAWNKALTIATVRNPYDRAVSLWASRKRPYGFDKWCEVEILQGPWNVLQTHWTHDEEGRCRVNLLLRFEHLNKNWHHLPRIGKSDHTSFVDYYNEDLMDKINEAYEEDFKAFNYPICDSMAEMYSLYD